MRAQLLLLAPLLACGSSSSSPKAPGNTAPTPADAATLADDVAALVNAADLDNTAPWVQRVTFLGWTADHRAAFRLLICAPDPLGGRGDYCDLDVCAASASSGQDIEPPACESAAAFALGEPFDVAATTAAAEASLTALGPLTAGTQGALADAGVLVEHGSVLFAAGGGPRRVIHAPNDGIEEEEMRANASMVSTDYEGTSPDGACRVVLGRFTFLGWYEGVTGDIPRGFAVVTCDGA